MKTSGSYLGLTWVRTLIYIANCIHAQGGGVSTPPQAGEKCIGWVEKREKKVGKGGKSGKNSKN